MRMLPIGALAVAGILLAPTVAGAQGQNFSPRSEIRIAERCVPCQSKCRRCLAHGPRPGAVFKTLEACVADCMAHGDPLVVSTCGVYRRC
jgi:hypothetical protein